MLIKEILLNDGINFLITRPRLWGKTLNLSMIKYFFGMEVDENGKKTKSKHRILFTGGAYPKASK
jgi:hypothetical protein